MADPYYVTYLRSDNVSSLKRGVVSWIVEIS